MNLVKIVAYVKAFLATPAGKVTARIGAVFVAAFVAEMVASGFDLAHVTDLAVYQKAVLAGWAAVLQLLGSITIGGMRVVQARRSPLRGLSIGRLDVKVTPDLASAAEVYRAAAADHLAVIREEAILETQLQALNAKSRDMYEAERAARHALLAHVADGGQ